MIKLTLHTFYTLTREISSFEYCEIPFQSARFQNSVVPHFIESVVGRAEAGTEDDVIPDRGVFEP